VFNPFSLLSFFNKKQYGAYWFTSGAPQFLLDVFRVRPFEYIDVQDAAINELSLDSYDIEKAPLVSLLFQTGFLTVKSTKKGPPPIYALGFPNTEVSRSFGQLFLAGVSAETDPFSSSFVTGIRKALDDKDIDKIEDCLRGLYASVPYQLHIASEAFYQVIFLATMQFLGFRVLGEVSASEGRLDGSIDLINGKSYVIEFKYSKIDGGNEYDDKELADILEKDIAEAFRQIEERGYSDRYAGTNREVIKLAVAVAGHGKVKVAAGS
jgi:hypothetical protein